jgi:hypothetical protein
MHDTIVCFNVKRRLLKFVYWIFCKNASDVDPVCLVSLFYLQQLLKISLICNRLTFGGRLRCYEMMIVRFSHLVSSRFLNFQWCPTMLWFFFPVNCCKTDRKSYWRVIISTMSCQKKLSLCLKKSLNVCNTIIPCENFKERFEKWSIIIKFNF